MSIITEFQGTYRFLSNFHVEADGMTVEHRFQAAKTDDPNEAQYVLDAHSPGEAKRRGRRVTLRPDWDDIKVQVMRELLERKFSDPDLAFLLRATGDAYLVEGNTWNDTFWGVDLRTGQGKNTLGELLMERRANLRRS